MLRVAQHAERTDTGRQRQANEDSMLARAPIFVVADGMGGAQAGEVASLTAVQAFDGEAPAGRPEQILEQIISAANRTIHERARSDSSLAGMGTTITAAMVNSTDEEVAIGHVGDSRAYRLRDGFLQRLTKDHSLVEEMRRRGQITEEQAEDHPQRSIITRALGPEPEVQVDVQTVPAYPGDVFLLCSDGLTTMLGDERIRSILIGATSLRAAVRSLIDEANRAGGRDNITALLFQVEDPAAPLPRSERTAISPPRMRRRGAHEGQGRAGRPKRRWGRRIGFGALGLVVVCALLAAAYYGSRQVWFLGTDDSGRVTLYRGLPYELPFGLDLYRAEYTAPIQTGQLPGRRREAVTGNEWRSHGDAVDLIEDIERSEGI